VREAAQLPAAQSESIDAVDRCWASLSALKQATGAEATWPAVKLARQQAIPSAKAIPRSIPHRLVRTCSEAGRRRIEEKASGAVAVWAKNQQSLLEMVFHFFIASVACIQRR